MKIYAVVVDKLPVGCTSCPFRGRIKARERVGNQFSKSFVSIFICRLTGKRKPPAAVRPDRYRLEDCPLELPSWWVKSE